MPSGMVDLQNLMVEDAKSRVYLRSCRGEKGKALLAVVKFITAKPAKPYTSAAFLAALYLLVLLITVHKPLPSKVEVINVVKFRLAPCADRNFG
jgi:hypothetical protein